MDFFFFGFVETLIFYFLKLSVDLVCLTAEKFFSSLIFGPSTILGFGIGNRRKKCVLPLVKP